MLKRQQKEWIFKDMTYRFCPVKKLVMLIDFKLKPMTLTIFIKVLLWK